MMRWVFGADTKPFRKGLDDMRNQTKAFSGRVRGMMLNAFGVGAIIAGFRNLMVEMDRIHKLSIRFGETAETMQRLAHAAELNGSNMELVANAMGRVTKNAYEAATGNEKLAEQFANIGIHANEFVNLPLEQKVLKLAAAYDMGKGSGEAMAQMMQLLGRSGSEVIPLLAEGQQKLQDQMSNTSVVADSTVQSIKNFNDAITELKKNTQVVGAELFDVFRMIFGTIGAVIGMIIGNALTTIETLIGSVQDAGSIIGKVLSGDFDGAAESAKRFKDRVKTAMDETKSNVSATGDVIKELFDEITNPAGATSGGAGPDVDNIIAAAEEAAKAEEKRKKLAEEVAALQEDARIKELSLAERILEVEKKRAELIKSIDDPFNTETETLEKQKELLQNEKELSELNEKKSKDQEATVKKQADLESAAAKEIADLEAESAAIDREQGLAGMSEVDRKAALEAERQDLLERSREAGSSGDRKTELELSNQAKNLTPEIEALGKSIIDSANGGGGGMPTIATSSLASIGAGGSANLLTRDTTEQRKISLLEQIAENTGRSETGEVKIPEPV